MKKSELLKRLKEFDMHPGRKLGQNFLVDDNLLDFIVKTAKIKKGELVLEVGPGFGALTRKLLTAGAKVIAVEFDRRLCEYLRNNILVPEFSLVEGDVCRIDVAETVGHADFRCVANLPYSVSSVFIADLLQIESPPSSMIFMLQKEMAQRLAADMDCKNYGSLSVRTQAVYDVEIKRLVRPDVFLPPPAVDSAIVQFTRKKEIPSMELRKVLSDMVRLVFAQRRKMMYKALNSRYGEAKVLNAYEALSIDKKVRPEDIAVPKFIELAKLMGAAQ